MFTTARQRHAWLGLICSLWVLWQCFWNLLALYLLASASSYEELYAVLEKASLLDVSLMVRLILQILSEPVVSLIDGIFMVLGCVHAADWIVLLCFILYLSADTKKGRLYACAGLLVMPCLLLCLGAETALASKSVMQAMSLVRIFALGAALTIIILIYLVTGLFCDQIKNVSRCENG